MNKEFLNSYIETALWSSTDDSDEPLDSKDYKFSAECAMTMIADCEKFELACYNEFPQASNEFSDRQLAHDFWLTRNRHGAGFWDGDYPEPLATQLTSYAHSFKECTLYVGDDKLIYCWIG